MLPSLLLAACQGLQLARPAGVSTVRLASPTMIQLPRQISQNAPVDVSRRREDFFPVPVPRATYPAKAPAQASPTILVQGGSLRTWSYRSPAVEQVQVELRTQGRPLDADIELWNGPDNTPYKMRVYVENGKQRPFRAVIETPRGPNTVAIRNIGHMEFPFAAHMIANTVEMPSEVCAQSTLTIQGGALRTYPFEASVDSVQVYIKTDGRPLNARIELLQGPNNNKQVIELYTEDGYSRPFFCLLETPGSGNVVRVVNTAPVEFPMAAAVVPHTVNHVENEDVVIDGDNFGW
jgi:hypothetical protein